MNRANMTLWSLQMGLATKSCQDAVEALRTTVRDNNMVDDYDGRELDSYLEKICELLGLEDSFLEKDNKPLTQAQQPVK